VGQATLMNAVCLPKSSYMYGPKDILPVPEQKVILEGKLRKN